MKTTTTVDPEPDALPAPPADDAPRPRRRGPRWRRWLWRGMWLTVLGTLGWAGFYGASRGFTRRWRGALQEEFRRHGLDISVRRITLDPFAGLVAEGIRLQRLDERHTRVLTIQRAALDIDFKRLLQQRRAFLRSVELRGTRLDLPADPGDPQGPTVRVRRLEAKIYFLPDRIQLAQAEGEWAGIQLSASGEVRNPDFWDNWVGKDRGPASSPPTDAEREQRRARSRDILLMIRRFHFEGETPRVILRFNADLARPPAEARASAEVHAGHVRLRPGGYECNGLRARLDWMDGALRLRETEVTDAVGRLAISADYTPADGQARWTAEGALDLLAVWRHLRGDPPAVPTAAANEDPLASLVLRDPPRLRVEGRAKLPSGEGLGLTGHLGLGRTAFRGVTVERLESDFSWRPDGAWFLRDLRLTTAAATRNAPAQTLAADVLHADGQFRLRLAGALGPATLVPLLSLRARNALRDCEFSDLPRLEINAVAPLPTPGGDPDWTHLRADGKIALGHTRFRGVPLNRLTGDYTLNGEALTVRNLQVDRDEGGAHVDVFTYDFARHEARIENLKSNVFPAEVAVWTDAELAKNLRPFRFVKPPAATANGVVQFDGGMNSRLTVDFTAPAGFNYTFARHELHFASASGHVLFTDPKLFVNDFRGSLFGGEMAGELELAIGKGVPPDYRAGLELRDLDFAPLTKLYFDYAESRGRLFGTYKWSGRGDDAGTMRGTGSLRVERGNVLAIPLFGPLSPLLDAALPGVGQPVAHLATGDFLINNGKIYNGNLQVKGPGLSMLGGGWLGFTDDSMNYRLRVNAQGLVGAILYPVSKLFEYGSQGPLHKPVWRPRALAPVPPAPVEVARPPAANVKEAKKTPPKR